MTDIVSQIAALIRARLDEDELAARSAKPGPWEYDSDLDDPDPCEDEVYSVHDGEHGDLVGDPVCFTRGKETVGNGVHIARQGPDRVLRGVAWKREVVDDYTLTLSIRDEAAKRLRAAGDRKSPADLDTWARATRELSVMERWVRLLVGEWSDHEDYVKNREEWKS